METGHLGRVKQTEGELFITCATVLGRLPGPEPFGAVSLGLEIVRRGVAQS